MRVKALQLLGESIIKHAEIDFMLRPGGCESINSASDGANTLYQNSPSLALEVQFALIRVLASPEFRKCQSTSGLLRFLVKKALAGALEEASEYAIGINVFERDPTIYNTRDDSIVRIQIECLREKLSSYYANAPAHIDLHFVIPMVSYVPIS